MAWVVHFFWHHVWVPALEARIYFGSKRAPMKKKPVKKKPAKKIVKKPATSLAVPHTQGQSEFAPSAYSASREKPLGGVVATDCHGAHAGIPGSVNLQPLWLDAMKETYGEHVSRWSDYVSDKSNCWHLIKTLHDKYDANNEEEDEKTNMIAFLPTMKLPVEVQPTDKMLCEHPFDAYILARGADARKTAQFFVAGVCAEYGGKTDGESRFKIGEAGLITIFTEYQNDLREAVEDLQKREFNYTEATKLTLKGHGSTEKTTKYDVITKSTISDEVQKVANLADVKVSFRHAPDWLDDANTPKYMKVSVAGVVHFFNLRVRACRLLKHKYLGSLPNRREQDHMSDSQELSDTEVEHLAAEPLAWKLSRV